MKCYSIDGEVFHDDLHELIDDYLDQFDTSTLTTIIGQKCPFHEADKVPLTIQKLLPYVGDHIEESMAENAYEEVGEVSDKWPCLTTEELKVLTVAVQAAVKDWLEKNGKFPTFYSVTNVKNKNFIITGIDDNGKIHWEVEP